jgi:hypothetical protein
MNGVRAHAERLGLGALVADLDLAPSALSAHGHGDATETVLVDLTGGSRVRASLNPRLQRRGRVAMELIARTDVDLGSGQRYG